MSTSPRGTWTAVAAAAVVPRGVIAEAMVVVRGDLVRKTGRPVRNCRDRGRGDPCSTVAQAGQGGSYAGEGGTDRPLLLWPPTGLRDSAVEPRRRGEGEGVHRAAGALMEVVLTTCLGSLVAYPRTLPPMRRTPWWVWSLPGSHPGACRSYMPETRAPFPAALCFKYR